MDPLAAAGASAPIVGLVCALKAERAGNRLDEFLAWLDEEQHEDIAASITNNLELALQLSKILATNHAELSEKLNRVDLLLSSIAVHRADLAGPVKSIHAQALLSGQAVSILGQLVSSGPSCSWRKRS